ncbi:hypothetical protein HD600_000202 [Microbacterium ginsengiterrae]|uniref:Uncharacterized protein n=1 Tax=Microbacterium ginsengiterrae TaxID=546115 RepID=A0A7W9C9U9_9MICO|nr:hypothetical protein [Microbacterium ginsengiterrae]
MTFDASRYADLLEEAHRAFLEDTAYAIALAEDASAMKTRQENRDDPDQLRTDVLRLHAQGAGLGEIQRVVHASRESVAEVLKDAPARPGGAFPTVNKSSTSNTPAPKPVTRSKRLRKWKPEPLAPDDPRHGTNNGYVNYRCRCDPCGEARKTFRRRLKENPAGRAKSSEHGTRSRYARGCRCDDCKHAATSAARADRDRKREGGGNTTPEH